MENSIQKRKGSIHARYGSVIIKSLKARIQTMSFPIYINFKVNNSEGGRSNVVVHSHAVILMLFSLFPKSFGIFLTSFWYLDFTIGDDFSSVKNGIISGFLLLINYRGLNFSQVKVAKLNLPNDF